MSKVTYIESNGISHVVEANEGQSLMQVAINNLVPGILGDCGGACSCATCHVYVDPAWLPELPAKSSEESFILDSVLEVRENSRLSCQLRMSEAWDGLVLSVPESQS